MRLLVNRVLWALFPGILVVLGLSITAAGTFPAAKVWLENAFADLVQHAQHPLFPLIIGLVVLAYASALIWTGRSPERKMILAVSPAFWCWGRRFKIDAVHELVPDDTGGSGWRKLGQNSREDQWQRLIEVESSWLNTRHVVRPLVSDRQLTVVISRDGKERPHHVEFPMTIDAIEQSLAIKAS
jgi:hypothetical protein